MLRLSKGACCAVTLALALPAGAQQRDFSQVQIQSEKVAGNVHMLVSGVAGNIGVSAGPDGILIVDDQFAPLADKIRASLATISAGEPEFVINTHWHGDHTGGNEVFGTAAVIVAHENVRKRLAAGSQTPGRVAPPATGVALPEITYGDSVSLHFNGEEIRVVHLPPGHTDGDSRLGVGQEVGVGLRDPAGTHDADPHAIQVTCGHNAPSEVQRADAK